MVPAKESPMIKSAYGSFKRVSEIRVMKYFRLCVPCIGSVECLYVVQPLAVVAFIVALMPLLVTLSYSVMQVLMGLQWSI